MNPISLLCVLSTLSTIVAMSLMYAFLCTPLLTIPAFLLIYVLLRKMSAFSEWRFPLALAVIVLASCFGTGLFPIVFALVLDPTAFRLLVAGSMAGLIVFSFLDVIYSLIRGTAITKSSKKWAIPLFVICGSIGLIRFHPCGLMYAAEDGYQPIVQVLIVMGQDVNGPTCEFPPLVKGAKYPGIIQDLLAAGADVNQTSRWKQSALHLARGPNAVEVAQILLNAHANVKAVDAWGETPLFSAVKRGNLELVKLLLNAGADANQANKAKQTPLILAKESNFPEIEKLLETVINPIPTIDSVPK